MCRGRGVLCPYEGLVELGPDGRPRWTRDVRFVPEALDLPLRWTKPRRIFVNSMSDLFHEKVADEWIDRIFAVMALAHHHTFQVLTKRPERMRAYLSDPSNRPYHRILDAANDLRRAFPRRRDSGISNPREFPMPWVHLGVSVEDQATADERIPLLLQTPAMIRWLSYEPALGPVSFKDHDWTVKDYLRGTETCQHSVRQLPGKIDWLVIGGESGPGARPFDLAWARSAIAQCRAAGVPVFMKQVGARPVLHPVGGVFADPEGWSSRVPVVLQPDGSYGVMLRDRKGGDPSEWPEDLRVREFPR